MIRNVLFDLGGVLVDLDVQRTIAAFKAIIDPQKICAGGVIAPQDLLGVGGNALINRYQMDDISSHDFIDSILSVCKTDTSRQQVEDAWLAMLVGIKQEKADLIKWLKKQGLGIYVLSNINEMHVRWTVECLRKAGVYDCFDRLFFSNEIRLAKPDMRCYRLVTEQTGIRPEDTLYIDDLQPNIEAGYQAGFKCLLAEGDTWMDIVKEKFACTH